MARGCSAPMQIVLRNKIGEVDEIFCDRTTAERTHPSSTYSDYYGAQDPAFQLGQGALLRLDTVPLTILSKKGTADHDKSIRPLRVSLGLDIIFDETPRVFSRGLKQIFAAHHDVAIAVLLDANPTRRHALLHSDEADPIETTCSCLPACVLPRYEPSSSENISRSRLLTPPPCPDSFSKQFRLASKQWATRRGGYSFSGERWAEQYALMRRSRGFRLDRGDWQDPQHAHLVGCIGGVSGPDGA